MNDFSVVKTVLGQISCELGCCNTIRVAPFIQFHTIHNTFPLKNIKVFVILLGMMTVFFTPAYPAIKQVGTIQSAYVTGISNVTLTLAKPAGLTVGDIMIVNIVK